MSFAVKWYRLKATVRMSEGADSNPGMFRGCQSYQGNLCRQRYGGVPGEGHVVGHVGDEEYHGAAGRG